MKIKLDLKQETANKILDKTQLMDLTTHWKAFKDLQKIRLKTRRNKLNSMQEAIHRFNNSLKSFKRSIKN